MTITWGSARAWRLGRHFLVGDGAADVSEVVGRLSTVPLHSGDPELAVALRLATPQPGAVAAALDDGLLVRTFTFGGTSHLMRPGDAGDLLAVRASGRQWERPAWQEYYALTPADWPELRALVRHAVSERPLTRGELAAAVTSDQRFAHLGPSLTDASCTLLKPLAWQGDVVLGPSRGGEITLQSPHDVPGWTGVAAVEEAGPRAVVRYLDAYGPATAGGLRHWFGDGLSAGRLLDGWLRRLGDRIANVDVEGDDALCLAEHVTAISSSEPLDVVTLVPGHDQWVRGPGTSDTRIVPGPLRPLATRGARLVLVGGEVAGSWQTGGETLEITLAAGRTVPGPALEEAAARLHERLGTPVVPVVLR